MKTQTLLPDIPRGETWTEAFRAECEARKVMRLPKPEREAIYRSVAQLRGQAAAQRLAEDVSSQWRKNGSGAFGWVKT